MVMVFGEIAKTRKSKWKVKRWTLGESSLQEVDENTIWGYSRLLPTPLYVGQTREPRPGKVPLFALNSRFRCLHPLTSLKLYRSLCLPIMLHGSDVDVL